MNITFFMNIYLKRFTLCVQLPVAMEPILDELWENDVDMRTLSHHVSYLFEHHGALCNEMHIVFNTLGGSHTLCIAFRLFMRLQENYRSINVRSLK
jgi:hypothetical protein